MKDRIIHFLLGAVLIFALAFSGCAAHKQHGPPAPQAEPISQADSARPGVVAQPPRSILDKLTGRTPEPQYYPPGTPVIVKGKKNTLTVNHVAGNQSNQTNKAEKNATAGTGATGGGKSDGPVAGTGGTLTNIEKAKAPVSTGTGDATDQSGTGVGSTIKGDNNTPVLTNTAPPKRSPWEVVADNLTGPVGWGLGIIVLVVALVKGGPWLVAAFRRSKSEANQA